MQTDEEQGKYITENKAAIIERPRKAHAIGDHGLEEYELSGWVKMSAKFCAHIKRLRGAKLSIWLTLALNIDENGECQLSQKELCEMTGYSHTEVIASVTELDEMGFLSVDRSGKRNLYQPVFVAKGKGNSPGKQTLVKKLDSTPVESVESSPAYMNSSPTSVKKDKESDEIFATIAKSLSAIQGGGLKSTDGDYIITWLENHPSEWILKAVGMAKNNGAKSSKYVDSILIGWEANGYPKTREQLVQERKAKLAQSGSSKQDQSLANIQNWLNKKQEAQDG